MKQGRTGNRKGRKSKQKQCFTPGWNDRGSSLVEIIVSMLVLAIIIIPMLNMFVTSNRINLNTRQKQYANVVLENTMEEIKAGVITRDPANVDPMNPNRFPIPISALSPRNQGTGSFDVEVVYEAVSGTLNSYQLPEINGFDSENTVVLMVQSEAEFPEVVNFFREGNKYATDEENQRRIDQARADYLTAYETWYRTTWQPANPGVEPGPADYEPFDESTVPTLTPVPASEIEGLMVRDTLINFETDGSKCRVNAEFRYSLPAVIDVGQAAGTEGEYNSPFYKGEWFEFDKLKYLYVLSMPFYEISRDRCFIDVGAVYQEPQFHCDVYVAQQKTALAPYDLSVEVRMPNFPSWGGFQIYGEQLNVSSITGVTIPYYNTLVPVSSSPENKVFTVHVRVMAEGSTEVLAEAETLVYEKKE